MKQYLLKTDLMLADTALFKKEFLFENCKNLKQLYTEQTDFDEDFYYFNLQFENEARQLSISIATWYHDVSIDISNGVSNKSSIWMN